MFGVRLHQNTPEKPAFIACGLAPEKVIGQGTPDVRHERLQTWNIRCQLPYIRLQIRGDIVLQQSELGVQLKKVRALRILPGEQLRTVDSHSPVF